MHALCFTPYTHASVGELTPEQVAWLATNVAYGATEDHIKAYCLIAKSQRFQIDTRKLYNDLVACGDKLVSMESYESRFCFKWKLYPDNQLNDDPFFLRTIERAIERSLESFVVTLDLTCTSLAGLEPDQTRQSVLEDVMRVRCHATHEIMNVMRTPGSTDSDIVTRLRALENSYSAKYITKHKESLKSSLVGVAALAKIANAALERGDMNDVMQINYASAREACLNTPRHLEEQLAIVGLSLSVIRACFSASCTFVGASSLPPPWAKLVDIVHEFFLYDKTAADFSAACNAALAEMRNDVLQSVESNVWSGVELELVSSVCARGGNCGGTFDTVQALHSPDHRGGSTGMAVVAVNATHRRALRVVRFMRTLLSCAECGYFSPRCVKSSILLSSVARFNTENRFVVNEVAESLLRPLEDVIGAQCPLIRQEPSSSPISTPRLATCRRSVIPTTAVTGNVISTTTTPHVSFRLERDYNIVLAFLQLVSSGTPTVLMKHLRNLMMQTGRYFYKHAQRSVEQSVVHVVKKCLRLAHASSFVEGVMEYERGTGGQNGGGLVRLDVSGATSLRHFLNATVRKMQTGDPAYDKEWHVSRTSRNRASRDAADRTVATSRKREILAVS